MHAFICTIHPSSLHVSQRRCIHFCLVGSPRARSRGPAQCLYHTPTFTKDQPCCGGALQVGLAPQPIMIHTHFHSGRASHPCNTQIRQVLTTKDGLCNMLQKSGLSPPELWAFSFPCWVLPKDIPILLKLLSARVNEGESSFRPHGGRRLFKMPASTLWAHWIAKPARGSQGLGISLVNTSELIRRARPGRKRWRPRAAPGLVGKVLQAEDKRAYMSSGVAATQAPLLPSRAPVSAGASTPASRLCLLAVTAGTACPSCCNRTFEIHSCAPGASGTYAHTCFARASCQCASSYSPRCDWDRIGVLNIGSARSNWDRQHLCILDRPPTSK